MKRSERLRIVLELAEREENTATAALQEYQEKLAQEEKILADIETYYADYVNEFNHKEGSIRIDELISQRQFLQKLADMKKQQAIQIDKQKLAVEKKMEIWRACHLKYQSLQDLISRLRRDENIALEKQEQKFLDEWFSRAKAYS